MLPKILVVDDDRHTRLLLERLLANVAQVSLAIDGAQAKQLFSDDDFNLVLMDQRLPDANGLLLLREFRASRPRLAVREGLFDYQTKPFDDLEALEAVIGKALELDRAYREINDLRARLASDSDVTAVVGQSPAMEQVLSQIRQVAGLDTTVLLEGESGTGKDLAAKLIHALSPRAAKPFLEVNCGGLPESLLESLLFGHEKGAFTGAMQASAGYFEKVNGGNLFLDEIPDMSPKLQSSLLRVLQDQSYMRIGSTQPRKAFVKTFTIGSPLLRYACHRCATARATSFHWQCIFWIDTTSNLANSVGRLPLQQSNCSNAAVGKAMYASSNTAWSALLRCTLAVSSTLRTLIPGAVTPTSCRLIRLQGLKRR